MKGSKSPDTTEVTPSKKKLKQARLPFMVLSDVSPKTAQPRKRKLSDPQEETASKIGKLSKENEVADSIVISDEECIETPETSTDKKLLNPYVKLVDTANKKKLRKAKTPKRKKGSKNITLNGNTEENPLEILTDTEVSDKKAQSEPESMEVDNVLQNGDTEESDNKDSNKDKSPEQTNNKISENQVNESIVLEESIEPEVINLNQTNDPKTTDDTNNIDTDPKSQIGDSEAPPSSITPKRASSRNKSKVDNKNTLNTSTISSKLDESNTSTPTTPKTPRQNHSVDNGHDGDVSINNSTNLTPKQVQKKLESAKKKEERELEKLEREKKRQQEKEERAKQKQEKEEQRKKEREEKEAAKRKEKEDKEEQRKKEKEEKEKQKEWEKKMREEKEEQKRKEKEEKEEQKRKEKEAREEEKKKKQEALELEKQEQELKKKKAAEAFVNFFVPKQKSDKEQRTIESSKNSMLSTFAIKSDMKLAPTTRNNISEEDKKKLEDFILKQGQSELYIKSLKSGSHKPLSSGKTWPLGDKDDDDVMIIEDELPPMDAAEEIITCEPAVREKMRPKLLSFHENRRPPYWGTWRKKSSVVKPRKPFGQEKQLDYEVDSDDDWEEEQEGESLDGSVAGSEDEQENDEYEVDNEVFVPHGYLSDEEATMDEDDVLSLTPEAQKQKLKHLEEEFESELKKPTEKLKPRLYGLLWETSDGEKPENCVDALWDYFKKLSMIMGDPTPFMQSAELSEDVEKKKVKKKKPKRENKEAEQSSPKTEKKKQSGENKEVRKRKPNKVEVKKVEAQKKNQPGINTFLTKLKTAT